MAVDRHRNLRLVVTTVSFAMAVGACRSPAEATFVPGVEGLPAPGTYYVVSEPRVAAQTLSMRLVGHGDYVYPNEVFEAGEEVVLTGTDLPTQMAVSVNGARCEGAFELLSDREVDVTVIVGADRCTVRLDRMHGAVEIDHGIDDRP